MKLALKYTISLKSSFLYPKLVGVLFGLLQFIAPTLGQTVQLTGYIQDGDNKERLIGATLYDSVSTIGSITNDYGFFSLSLPKPGAYAINLQYLGYDERKIFLSITQDTFLILELTMSANQLQEIEIKANRTFVKPTDGSVARLSVREIKKLPRLLGETDPVKSFQLLPGVQGGAEGSSALYVRGGSPDQNLILLDDIPLYFVNHLGGFLSVIDADAINAIKLYKGGFPARFGGRLSSVLDIRLKDGNLKKWEKGYSIGLLSTKAAVSGPLIKEKLSILATVRRSNLDLLSGLANAINQSDDFSAGFYFYDTNVKLNYAVSDKDRISASFYAGKDKFFLKTTDEETTDEQILFSSSEVDNRWGNIASAIRWNHLYNAKLFSNYTLSYSRFNYLNLVAADQTEMEGNEKTLRFQQKNQLSSAIQDLTLRLHHEWQKNGTWRFGALFTHQNFDQPELFTVSNNQFAQPDTVISGNGRLNSLSANLYIEKEGKIGSKIDYNIGLHNSIFWTQNQAFINPQPRLVINYGFREDLQFKLGYARMVQNIHLLSNSGAGVPTDLWVPATANAQPETADIISVGGLWSSPNKDIKLEAEIYYKQMRNQLDFSQGASFFAGGGNWEEKVEFGGIGRAYGLEILLKKESGKFQGWLGYTWARNFRQFSIINDGNKYPFRFDRPHTLELVGIWEPNERFSLSANWTIESGYAITLASTRYEIDIFSFKTNPPGPSGVGPQNAYLYESRNNFRMPTYHRLDINCNFPKEIQKKGRTVTRTWSLGVYNLYNQQNPYFLFYDTDDNNEIRLYQFALFPVLPYISYERKF